MGLLDKFLEKHGLSWSGSYEEYYSETNSTLQPSTIPASGITPEAYLDIRAREVEFLETHYNLKSAAGINSIPERSDLPRLTLGDSGGFRSYTADIDDYLRKKSQEYEADGQITLALLCLKKSNAIRMVSRRGHSKDEYYSYVRLLARSGLVEEAVREKEKIDNFFGENHFDSVMLNGRAMANRTIKTAYEMGTKLLIMDAHGCACPECAKYQGRVFSIYGKDPRFPPLPKSFYEYGAIHKGCRHSFFPYFDWQDGDLKYTLSIQKIKSWRYSRNIRAYSNRPFVDDRPKADVEAALQFQFKLCEEEQHQQELWDNMIEFEAARGREKRKYKWIQENLPEMCPKSYSGFRRMKTQNTKNYQKIVAAAKEHGVDL